MSKNEGGLYFIVMIFVGIILMTSNASANPLPTPDLFVLNTGPEFESSYPLRLESANVSISCYPNQAIGLGKYIITNEQNVSGEFNLKFEPGYLNFSVLNVLYSLLDNTSTPVSVHNLTQSNNCPPPYSYPHNSNCEYRIGVWNYSRILLTIEWVFQNQESSTEISNPFLPLISNTTNYHAVYAINGGYCWGNNSIGKENVRFYFYDRNFLCSPSEARVFVENQSDCSTWKSDQYQTNLKVFSDYTVNTVQCNEENVPYLDFKYENLMESVQIHITNIKTEEYFSTPYDVYIIVIALVICLSLPFFLISSVKTASILALIQLGLTLLNFLISFLIFNINLFLIFKVGLFFLSINFSLACASLMSLKIVKKWLKTPYGELPIVHQTFFSPSILGQTIASFWFILIVILFGVALFEGIFNIFGIYLIYMIVVNYPLLCVYHKCKENQITL